MNGSDLDKMCGKDALYASDKTFVPPKQVVRFLLLMRSFNIVFCVVKARLFPRFL